MPYPPQLPEGLRDDDTRMQGTHAEDHNLIRTAIADLVAVLGSNPQGAAADLTARLAAGGGGGSATNLTASRTATAVTVASDTGADATLPAATTTLAGVLSAADKVRLDNALAALSNVFTLAAATQQFAEFTVVDDGSATAGWPNRFEWWFDPAGTNPRRLVTWWNEYGEYRGVGAKVNTTAFRIFLKELSSDADHSASSPVLEVQDNRDTRNTMFAVMGDGSVRANAGFRVLGQLSHGASGQPMGLVRAWPTGSEPSLTDVPDGTLWVEYTP